MARARGERATTAVAFESTENTAPTSGYTLLDQIGNTVALKRGLLEDDIIGTRDPGDVHLDNPVVDGEVTVPVDVAGFGFWLKALAGAPTTTESTGVFTHVFAAGDWALPSFAMEMQQPDVPSFEMFTGCRADSLRIDLTRTGRVNATIGVVGQGSATPTATTAAGTPATRVLERFMQRQVVVKIGGSAVANVVSMQVNYANNLDRVETITSGGHIGGLDPMRTALTGDLRLRFDSEALFTTARAETAVAVDIEITRTAEKKLTLSMPRVFLSVPDRPVNGPGGVEASFSFIAARASNGDPMLTATLINGVSGY